MTSPAVSSSTAHDRRWKVVPPLIWVFALLAALNVVSVAAGWSPLQWATKPLLAPVLALHLWRMTGRRHAPVLAGLGFAAAGDVALLVSGTTAFLTGIGFFLGAQICWTVAFLRAGAVEHLRERRTLCAAYLCVWAIGVAAIAPQLDPAMAVAIAGYSLPLVGMALAAHAKGRQAAWGGAVFVFSDLLIGIGAAGTEFAGRPVLVMSTYALALALITTAFTSDRDGEPR